MSEDLKQMREQAADLGKTAEQAAAELRVRQEAAQRAAEARVLGWEKRMQRTFKGIMSRPVRRRFLDIAVERADDA